MLIIKYIKISTFNTLKLVYGYLVFFMTRGKNCLFYLMALNHKIIFARFWDFELAMQLNKND
jgi:hypothetical protein